MDTNNTIIIVIIIVIAIVIKYISSCSVKLNEDGDDNYFN